MFPEFSVIVTYTQLPSRKLEVHLFVENGNYPEGATFSYTNGTVSGTLEAGINKDHTINLGDSLIFTITGSAEGYTNRNVSVTATLA